MFVSCDSKWIKLLETSFIDYWTLLIEKQSYLSNNVSFLPFSAKSITKQREPFENVPADSKKNSARTARLLWCFAMFCFVWDNNDNKKIKNCHLDSLKLIGLGNIEQRYEDKGGKEKGKGKGIRVNGQGIRDKR